MSIGKLKDAANKTVLSQRQDQQNHGKELSKGQLEKNKLKERAEALRKEVFVLIYIYWFLRFVSVSLVTCGSNEAFAIFCHIRFISSVSK